jgi:DNA-binding FadR family transcriptional regulator
VTLTVEPIQVPSLKLACTSQLERLILSGELKIGERLPSERNLAVKLNVSRPVVHQSLVDLETKGLVVIVPRKGVYVSDYRTTGSFALLTTLLEYNGGELDDAFMQSLADVRLLLEAETARLAAKNRTTSQLARLREIVEQEATANRHEPQAMADLDFAFHLAVALASGNQMYPLILNSFKAVYTSITRRFFAQHQGDGVLDAVLEYHRQLLAAIEDRDSQLAADTMAEMLQHGLEHLE